LANRSTELTLSAQRIDLIRDELKDVIEHTSQDHIFHDVEKSLFLVKDLQKSRMYGAAINILKKNLEVLDARIARHDSFDIKEMNRLLIECNAQLAHCYYQVMDHRLSIDYARAALNLDSKNTQAIYYLGSGLNKSGDILGGYSVLKEIKRFGIPAGHDEYLTMIESEIMKFEKKIEEGARKGEMGLISPVLQDLQLATAGKVDKKQPETSALANIGVFAGTSGLAGAVSWMLSKDHFKLSERKAIAYSVGVGALVGTVSLGLMAHFRGKTAK